MPAMLLPEHVDPWLDPDQEAGRLTSLLRPYPAGEMEAYPVSARVNSPANDSANLLDPVPARDAMTAVASAGPNPL
jgi:putative SOS response-associated peptidase YedK